jgi:regulator of sigma E protease
MTNLLMVVITLLILSVLVVVHEWGHYITARKNGVYVMEFAIGMGPKIYSRQGKQTLFSIRAFPIGGFCRLYGETEEDSEENDDSGARKEDTPELPEWVDESWNFKNKTKGQRFVILIAGAMMNVIFAILCLIVVFLLRGQPFGTAVVRGFTTTWTFAGMIFSSLGMLFGGQLSLNDFAGPIGMVTMVSDFYQYGFAALLSFTALISVNLGIINLLPLPALDGGQALILIIEKIVGKDLNPKKADMINTIGFVALMVLAIVIAINDVLRIAG